MSKLEALYLVKFPENEGIRLKTVQIFTDGACKGNPGPGGWAALLRFGGNEKIISGHDRDSTNNRMELAVIRAFSTLKEPCRVELFRQQVRNRWNYEGLSLAKARMEDSRQTSAERRFVAGTYKCCGGPRCKLALGGALVIQK